MGLVAGRLAAEFNRPAIILNDSTDGLLRGSARSVEGLNITEAITSTEHLLRSFGGHPMAAGLSLPADNLFEFAAVSITGFLIMALPFPYPRYRN